MAPPSRRRSTTACRFDAVNDLAPVTQLVASNLILVASPKSGITSMQQLIAEARANPGKLNYGSSGVGNPLHLTMEMIKHANRHRHSRGAISAATRRSTAALIAGDVENRGGAARDPPCRSFRTAASAASPSPAPGARRRSPDIPTVAESGVPGFCLQQLAGLVHDGKDRRSRSSSVSSRRPRRRWRCPMCVRGFAAMAYEGVGQPPRRISPAYYKDEIAKFTKVIADAKNPETIDCKRGR